MGLTRCTVLLALKGFLFLDENTLGPFQTVHQLAIMLWRNVREILDRGRFRRCLIIREYLVFLGARGIGTNSANERVFKKNLYFDDVTKNRGFLSDPKTDIARFPDCEVFLKLAHG